MNSAQVFTDNWKVYQEIVQRDYMYHKTFERATAMAWKSMSPLPGQVLDIGCGDAATMLPHVRQYPGTAFTGYDLSDHALALAAENLSALPNSTRLSQGDMLDLLQQERQTFNLIHSSFAIHHLHDDMKQQFFEACYGHLEPGGLFIYVDVFRQPGQTREAYLTNYFNLVETAWHALEAWEKKIVCDHVQEYDFPAVISDCTRWLQATGFTLVHQCQPDERHMMLQWRKH